MPSPAGLRRLLPPLLAVLACGALAASAAAAPRATAVIAFLPGEYGPQAPGVVPPQVGDLIDAHPQLSLGMLSATQSGYSPTQALLDLTAGTRTSRSTYHPQTPPPLYPMPVTGSGLTVNWLAAVARAETAPADIVPGLLASSVPGGAGYAGIAHQVNAEAVAATDRAGRIAAVSLGRGETVAARAQTMLKGKRLVVALLPPGYAGDGQLDLLIAHRAPGELLIAIEDPPPLQAPQLLWTGIAGLGRANAGLTSASTHIEGIAVGIDVLPTILGHLGIAVPRSVRGEPITISGARDAGALQQLDDRLSVISSRRMPALQTFLFTLLALLLVAGILRDRAGVRFALRIGGLALMWLPTMVLLSGALLPSQQAELFLLAGSSFLLALATDRLLAWPRGPAAPALVALAAYTIDLANHSHLVIRSLLGPSPRSGSRFYGLGNELEIVLTLLLLIAVAALLRRRERTRGGALAFAGGGILLAAIAGSGRLGADVGAIFTIGAGAAVATLMMLPGGITRRGIALAVATPLVGLAALAALDLVTGGNGHFERNVLHGSSGDQLNTLKRRYEVAWSIVSHGTAPLLTLLCVLAVIYAVRHRERIYATVKTDPVWRACLGGGLAASIAGSLFNDSGPNILFIGIVALTFLTTYLRSAPEAEPSAAPPPTSGHAVAAGAPSGLAPPAPEPAAASPS